MSDHRPVPWITLLAGPTASGKSALAMDMAERTGAVILNADSQQLYADLRVLTARPSTEDEARVEHRLYGVADAADGWSVGLWSRAVMTELETLAGRPVLLVGGTGLYFTALTRGLADIPPVSASMRQEVEAYYEREGETSFRRWLAIRDPAAEARIESGDRQRLVRAWAVAESTGRALSDWVTDTKPLLPSGSWAGLVTEPDRGVLYADCDRRVERMVQQGAIEEVRLLLARHLNPALPAMKAVGVRELGAFLRGETSQEEAIDRLRQATRNYAKRQLTWSRNQIPEWTRIGR